MGKVRVSYSIYKVPGELVLYCEHLMTALYRDPDQHTDAVEKKRKQKEKDQKI
jgi:hypothetical protein